MFRSSVAAAAGLALVFAFTSLARAAEDPVVATVNGTDILRSDLAEVHERLPEPYKSEALEVIFDDVVNIVIDRRLAALQAEKENLQKDPEVARRLQWVREQVLQRVLLDRHIREGVTEDSLRKRYEETVAAENDAEEVRARHILVDDVALAERLVKELEGGADFAALAKEHSTGPSAPKGGDIGYFKREGDVVEPFAEAAFALKPGEFTKKPVQTRYGWHVIQVEDRRKIAAPSFEDAKQQMADDLAQELGMSYIQELRDKAAIERFGLQGRAQ